MKYSLLNLCGVYLVGGGGVEAAQLGAPRVGGRGERVGLAAPGGRGRARGGRRAVADLEARERAAVRAQRRRVPAHQDGRRARRHRAHVGGRRSRNVTGRAHAQLASRRAARRRYTQPVRAGGAQPAQRRGHHVGAHVRVHVLELLAAAVRLQPPRPCNLPARR